MYNLSIWKHELTCLLKHSYLNSILIELFSVNNFSLVVNLVAQTVFHKWSPALFV